MRRILRGFLAFTLVGSGAVALSAPPAQAAADIDAGWWWRANPGGTVPTPAQAPVVVGIPTAPVAPPVTTAPPAPPNVGDGLMVAATPDGPSAIAAVRATGAGGTLTLTIADNSSAGTQVAKLLACRTTSVWTPVAGGRWDDKPGTSCDASNSAPGTASADGKSVVFAVDSLVTDGALDVAIVPAPTDAATGATAPFEMVFNKPTAEAFGSTSTATQDTATADFSSDFSYSGATDFSGSTTDFSSSDFSTSDVAGTFIPGTTTFTPGTPRVRTPAGARRVPALQQTPASVGRAVVPRSDDAKAFAVFVILLAAAAGYWVTRQQVPAVAGLGRVSVRSTAPPKPEVVEAGLGRFRKPRTGPPPRLF